MIVASICVNDLLCINLHLFIFQKQEKKDIEIIAINCDMVDTQQGNKLARVSIINSNYETIYDKFVKSTAKVTNYHTWLSGIRPEDIEHGEEFSKVKIEVTQILKNKLLIGHSLERDFRVLKILHPKHMIRDTSTYPEFVQLINGQTPSLKRLAFYYLEITIEDGKHRFVQNAKAALQLYMMVRNDWESQFKKSNRHSCNENKPYDGSQNNLHNSVLVQVIYSSVYDCCLNMRK